VLANKEKHSIQIKQWATELGFSHCGIAKAEFLEAEAPKLEEWLKRSYQGEMHYMENHFDMRLDPRILVPDAKSVISLTYNYYTDQKQNEDAPKISKYAYGEDYHHVVKDKLKILLQHMQETIGDINGRCFVDSAPVMERAWASKAGIGWIGKHSLLINKTQGSFFFLAEIIVDAELEYDNTFCHRPLRHLHRLYGRLPYQCHCRKQSGRRQQMHFLFYNRVERRDTCKL
jgi:epoxyqueuosine reductase